MSGKALTDKPVKRGRRAPAAAMSGTRRQRPARPGRPSVMTPEIKARLCSSISDGQSLPQIGSAENATKPNTVVANDPDDLKGILKKIGGSCSDNWNNIIANQTIQALWLKHSNPETQAKQFSATVAALVGIGPQDELEGMLAAQLIASHNASMECYRRAMLGEQTFEGRRESLSQANKLSRTYATLLEALNRHRGKGAQKVTVEHVHVHEGGQAIVGNVEAPGGGFQLKPKDQPHALAHAPGAPVPSTDTTREPVPVASNAERAMPDARGNLAGCPTRQ